MARNSSSNYNKVEDNQSCYCYTFSTLHRRVPAFVRFINEKYDREI